MDRSFYGSAEEVEPRRRRLVQGWLHKMAWLSFCLIWSSPGCSMFEAVARNAVNEPVIPAQRCANSYRNRLVADEAWKAVLASEGDTRYTCDYAKGFKQGFKEYLDADQTTSPPPVPPKEYWTLRYETPEGKAAVDNWFAGYRRGSEAAAQSQLRELVQIRSSGVGLPPSKDMVQLADVTLPNPVVPTVPAPLPLPKPTPMPPAMNGSANNGR